jgi:DNA-directed RNA polymerase specialized sigma24 family protein
MNPPMTSPPTLPAPSSDASLLAAARHDPDAFRELYERYAEAVHEYFLRRTGSRATALDLAAETFAQAWLVRARFRDEANGSAAPWIYGIARNVRAGARYAALGILDNDRRELERFVTIGVSEEEQRASRSVPSMTRGAAPRSTNALRTRTGIRQSASPKRCWR